MDEIKSAWEIAQEKIKNITTDKETVLEHENAVKGKRIISQFLENPEKIPLAEEIKSLAGKQKAQVIKGMIETLLANFTLPLTESAENRNARAVQGLTALAPGHKPLQQILNQIGSFFKNYMQEREQIEEALEQQYAPRLRQKADALAKQLGTRVDLKAAQDPEFIVLLKKNLSAYDERYTEALREAKAEIERLILAPL